MSCLAGLRGPTLAILTRYAGWWAQLRLRDGMSCLAGLRGPTLAILTR